MLALTLARDEAGVRRLRAARRPLTRRIAEVWALLRSSARVRPAQVWRRGWLAFALHAKATLWDVVRDLGAGPQGFTTRGHLTPVARQVHASRGIGRRPPLGPRSARARYPAGLGHDGR
jgi:hypothetical protein